MSLSKSARGVDGVAGADSLAFTDRLINFLPLALGFFYPGIDPILLATYVDVSVVVRMLFVFLALVTKKHTLVSVVIIWHFSASTTTTTRKYSAENKITSAL
jgi:hypothetical protein